jgi:cytosine deaminase
MRLDKTFGRIAPGAKADFILFHARTYSELFSRPQHDRVLIRNGVRVQPQLPEYAELDDLNAKCGDIDKNTIPA